MHISVFIACAFNREFEREGVIRNGIVFGLFSVLVCLSASLLHCQKLSPIQYKFVLALNGVLKGLYSYPYRTQIAHRYITNTNSTSIPRNAQTLYLWGNVTILYLWEQQEQPTQSSLRGQNFCSKFQRLVKSVEP